MDQASNPLSKKEMLFYGFGEMSGNLVWAFSLTWIMFFFTDVYKMSAFSAGTLLLLVRLYDGFKDPVVGLLVDRTSTKHGKARPYLLWFAIPFGISGCLLFLTPNFDAAGKLVYAYIAYFVFATFMSLVNIPYSTMMALMTKDQNERTKLSRNRGIFNIVAAILVSIVPAVARLLGSGGTELEKLRTGYFTIALIFGLIAITGYYLTYFNTKEQITQAKKETDEKYSVGVRLSALLKNGQWWAAFLLTLLANLRMAILSGLVIYYIKYYVGLTESFSSAAMILFLSGMLLGILTGPKTLMRTGYNKALNGTTIIGIIGCLAIVIDPRGLIAIGLFCLLNGFAQGIPTVAGHAMFADIVEYGEWKTGIRSEGLIISTHSLAQKISAALGGFIVGLVLVITGYNAELAEQSQYTSNGIMISFIGSLILFNLIRLMLIRFYKIDRKKYSQIMNELAQKEDRV